MSSRLLTVSVLALLACVSCAPAEPEATTDDLTRSLLAQPSGPDGPSTPVVESQIPQEGPLPIDKLGFDRGLAEAPVKVIEMSDYGCGYCRQFHQETFPTLLTEFIEAGIVHWKFAPYITGMFENSIPAQVAAECTYVQDPEAFEVLNTRLWADQPEWKGSDDANSMVRGWVSELGIDMDTFDACVAEDESIPRIAGSTALANRVGVRGTPTFFVLGYPPLQGALPLETFREVLRLVHEEIVNGPAGQ